MKACLPATEFELRSAASVTSGALSSFYERMFPTRAEWMSRHWPWLYRVGAYPRIDSPLVSVHEDEVVGHGGFIPVVLRCNDDERIAVWFVDFAVAPEHRRNNIASLLARAGMEFAPIQLGFGNTRSVPM